MRPTFQLSDEQVTRVKARRRLPPVAERRLLRLRSGLSALEVAKACKVSRAAVSRWETGSRNPRGAAMVRYVTILGELEKIR